MAVIKSVTFRKILNSHVNFTNEFIVELEDGAQGYGASPQGETISIYEDKKITVNPQAIIDGLENDGYLGTALNQQVWDAYLQNHIPQIGRNNAFGLSLAFFNAVNGCKSIYDAFNRPVTKLDPPHICLNILNGGWHAYTNPVLSDFSEFMLVAKSTNFEEVLADHNAIQQVVQERLQRQTKTLISGNLVNCFPTADNRECIEFLLNVCEHLHLLDKFELMIDASAGDLWANGYYQFGITDHSKKTSEVFYQYWMEMIRQYNLIWLEDPFHEKDFESWQCLSTSQNVCNVIGDNLYTSDSNRILEGAANSYANCAVIKPNQAGTVSAVCQAIDTTHKTGQIAITSHRSISTESTFLSALTCIYGVKYIKVGPLMTDYSSVIRFNEMIRLTEER